MKSSSSKGLKETRLADYQPPPYTVDTVDLHFELDTSNTTVHSTLTVRRTEYGNDSPFFLNGSQLMLRSILLNGSRPQYKLSYNGLTIERPPAQFVLQITNSINPSANTALVGLYVSGEVLCTQCEAEGFRNITYFPDRPDILSQYSVRISASKHDFPVLLSNGELADSGNLPNAKHYVQWVDPHPKPCYLFALVAGKLFTLEDEFVTGSGKKVSLNFYSESEDLERCAHAMECLKRAMRWDEEKYGCEYDLNRYMIVAVDSFVMGAMENKGLNIFNSKYVYAKPDTATDLDFHAVESVIAHEYFHNWSGNRVTLRDWFQLSLKEGFTIFRDQQFSADMGSAAVQRVRDIRMVKHHQFREDGGPASHPVQPDAYLTIDNFYTITIYNKGAELIRMLFLLLGPERYRAATDLYFDKYDGQAATVNDFISCMETRSELDLSQFRLWYKTAGTPRVSVTRFYDENRQSFTLKLKQHHPTNLVNSTWQPLHIPILFALLDQKGHRLPLKLKSTDGNDTTEMLLELRKDKQEYTFVDIPSKPVPSILRGFSAPVLIKDSQAKSEALFTLAYDDDPYCRWEACQSASNQQIKKLMSHQANGQLTNLDEEYLAAIETVLDDVMQDPEFSALILEPPSEIAIAQTMKIVDPTAIHQARTHFVRELAAHFSEKLFSIYDELSVDSNAPNHSSGRRSLRKLCLNYLISLDNFTVHEIALNQFASSDNMTDLESALIALVNSSSPAKQSVLRTFFANWQHEPVVIDKWFRIQATAARNDTLHNVRTLTNHQAFTLQIPNRIYSLIGAFCHSNPYCFHAEDGAGYDLLAKYVIAVDQVIPQAAAQLVEAFLEIKRYDDARQQAMHQRLQQIASFKGISVNVYEIVERILRSFEDVS